MAEQANAQNPYAPPSATVGDVAIPGVVDKAGRGARLGAALLDGLIGFVVALPAIVLNFGAMVAAAGNANANPFAVYGALYAGVGGLLTVALGLAWLIATILLVQRNGQTIGKKIVGIKVVRKNGDKAGLGRIFALRNLVPIIVSVIPLVGFVFVLVDHLFIFGAEKRCLHDMMADTIVVRA
jgi:uncharacterized RDD family membrane protein YckC